MFMRGFRPRTKSASCRRSRKKATSSASWATASTTRPRLRAADVGISVDTAVDIAKESADMILLEKNLMVLEEGVLEGRKVFANILKYIRMGASSNFGNMFSVLGASAWLPFLPMQPLQILTNNLLYDFSQVPIPDGQRRRAIHRQAAPVEHRGNRQVHHFHRPHQLDF